MASSTSPTTPPLHGPMAAPCTALASVSVSPIATAVTPATMRSVAMALEALSAADRETTIPAEADLRCISPPCVGAGAGAGAAVATSKTRPIEGVERAELSARRFLLKHKLEFFLSRGKHLFDGLPTYEMDRVSTGLQDFRTEVIKFCEESGEQPPEFNALVDRFEILCIKALVRQSELTFENNAVILRKYPDNKAIIHLRLQLWKENLAQITARLKEIGKDRKIFAEAKELIEGSLVKHYAPSIKELESSLGVAPPTKEELKEAERQLLLHEAGELGKPEVLQRAYAKQSYERDLILIDLVGNFTPRLRLEFGLDLISDPTPYIGAIYLDNNEVQILTNSLFGTLFQNELTFALLLKSSDMEPAIRSAIIKLRMEMTEENQKFVMEMIESYEKELSRLDHQLALSHMRALTAEYPPETYTEHYTCFFGRLGDVRAMRKRKQVLAEDLARLRRISTIMLDVPRKAYAEANRETSPAAKTAAVASAALSPASGEISPTEAGMRCISPLGVGAGAGAGAAVATSKTRPFKGVERAELSARRFLLKHKLEFFLSRGEHLFDGLPTYEMDRVSTGLQDFRTEVIKFCEESGEQPPEFNALVDRFEILCIKALVKQSELTYVNNLVIVSNYPDNKAIIHLRLQLWKENLAYIYKRLDEISTKPKIFDEAKTLIEGTLEKNYAPSIEALTHSLAGAAPTKEEIQEAERQLLLHEAGELGKPEVLQRAYAKQSYERDLILIDLIGDFIPRLRLELGLGLIDHPTPQTGAIYLYDSEAKILINSLLGTLMQNDAKLATALKNSALDPAITSAIIRQRMEMTRANYEFVKHKIDSYQKELECLVCVLEARSGYIKIERRPDGLMSVIARKQFLEEALAQLQSIAGTMLEAAERTYAAAMPSAELPPEDGETGFRPISPPSGGAGAGAAVPLSK